MLVPDVGDAATHTRREVPAGLSQDDNPTACHVFAAVVACPFDNGYRAGVADSEAFAHLSIDIEFSGGSAVQTGIAGYGIVFGTEVAPDWRLDGDTSAAETLGEVVVCLPFELEVHALHEECAETLPGTALELDIDGRIRQALFAVFRSNQTAEHRAHGAVGVLDGVIQIHLLLFLHGTLGRTDYLAVEDAVEVVRLSGYVVERRFRVLLEEQVAEVEHSSLAALGNRFADNQLGVAHDVVQFRVSHFSQILANLLGEEGEIVD